MLSKVRYCNNCNQTVAPKKNVSFIILALLLLFLILPGIIYLIYYLVQKGKCPICNGTNWRNVGSEDKFTDFQLADLKKKPPFFLCVECNIAFSTAAELYNHNVAKKHSPPKVMEKEEVGAKKYTEEARIKDEEDAKYEADKKTYEEELEKERIEEEEEKKTHEEELEKERIEEEEEKKTRIKISPKERLKNSPGLQGVLIGLVAVVVLLGIVSISAPQDTFYMNNDALSPDANQGDLLHYQKTPLTEIKKNDIIAFVHPDEESNSAAKIGKVREVWKDGDSFFFKTSSNAAPSNYSTITNENFIGKITSIESAGEASTFIYRGPVILFMIITAFVAPIIILKVRKRLQN